MASEVRIRAVARDYPVKRSTSPFDDWGAISEEAQSMTIFRWLIEMQSAGQWQEVGNLSAHAVWYGPTENSKAQRALKSAGFIYEGTLRKAQGRADGAHDLQVWSHLS